MNRVAHFGYGIRRDRHLSFRFNGNSLTGLEGDTLASALIANGVRVVGRSFKFHRPRGVFTCGVEEPNALVQLGTGARTTPSVRATLLELHEGLDASVPSGWPGLQFDLLRALDWVPSLWAAGFYNKTFIWPSWHTYEGLIRRMAGFGHAPTEKDPDRYDTRNAHCDVLVVGGGADGIRAASECAERGERVILVHQGRELSVTRLRDGADAAGTPSSGMEAVLRLMEHPQVRVLTRTAAVGFYERDVVTLLETVPASEKRACAPRERYWIVRTKRVILATGTVEQPLIFDNNDRPGIMLAGAARQYLRTHGVVTGKRVVIATNNGSGYALSQDLKDAGTNVVSVVDTREGWFPIDSSGFGGLSSVMLGRVDAQGTGIVATQELECDALFVSGGFTPALQLFAQAGGKLIYDEESGGLVPANGVPNVSIVGAATERTPIGRRVSPVGNTKRQWVDLRHDVTVADLELAIRENFASIEHVKRYTTVGMALDQGKTSNVPALEIIAKLRGIKPADLGHTTLRPPFVPVTLGAIAGRAIGEQFSPHRRLPMHDWHVANGAVMEDYGEWKRPAFYRTQPNESRREAIQREAKCVRSNGGLFDASSLGKIEIQGPDALEFLDRFYINNLKTLKPGRARYGLMLRESGILFDDGTVVMLSPDRLLMTTTTGNAGRVAAWLEEWLQCEWPHLRVAIVPVTDQWGTVSLAGPRAREVLGRLQPSIDLANEALPHLAMREAQLLGKPARIYRVSFTGELTYEINVPADSATRLWEALLEEGAPFGIGAFGIESLMLMRLEKGFLHLGADTDGTTVPDDVGWGKVAAGKNTHFVGKRSLSLPEHVRPDRLQLVGLRSETDMVVGSHLRLPNSKEATDGWVTSAGRMALGDEPIAMAMLRAGRSQMGAELTVHDQGRVTRAKVVEMPFYDPAGERMNA
jgi:sarcosine oxidase subunit alpha